MQQVAYRGDVVFALVDKGGAAVYQVAIRDAVLLGVIDTVFLQEDRLDSPRSEGALAQVDAFEFRNLTLGHPDDPSHLADLRLLLVVVLGIRRACSYRVVDVGRRLTWMC